MPDYESDEDVLAQLAGEFSAVPRRVLAAALAAYLAQTPSLALAAMAAHEGIADACAN